MLFESASLAPRWKVKDITLSSPTASISGFIYNKRKGKGKVGLKQVTDILIVVCSISVTEQFKNLLPLTIVIFLYMCIDVF